MSATRDILFSAAQMIADADDTFTFRSDGSAYQAGEVALVLGFMPQTPDRCVALNWVDLDEHPVLSMTSGILQAGIRGRNILEVSDLGDAVFAVLHGAEHLVWGTVEVNLISRSSSVPMPADENERLIRADQYAVDADMPAIPNRPSGS
jgi:hypothetical protein